MIYTLTLAPSLDYVMDCENIITGEVNRSSREYYYPGGKGINVSIVLKNLGVNSKALGFIGGFTGEYIKQSLDEMNIKHDFVELKGVSRINVKIKGTVETAINGAGPMVSSDYYGDLLLILNALKPKDYLILSGSVIKNFGVDIYEKIMIFLKNRSVNIIVDTSGEALMNCLKWHPFLVKPNLSELEKLFQVTLTSLEEIKKYGLQLIELGAKNAIVSLGEKGAIYINAAREITYQPAPKGIVINTVGAGDAMIAGFVYHYNKTLDLQAAFKYSVICGSASAFTDAMPTREKIEALL